MVLQAACIPAIILDSKCFQKGHPVKDIRLQVAEYPLFHPDLARTHINRAGDPLFQTYAVLVRIGIFLVFAVRLVTA